MIPGFDRPLYILPFDHRGTWEAELFGWPDPMNIAEMTVVEVAKQIAYDGFKAAIAAGVPREKAAILVDELYGAKILRQASEDGFMTACPAEKSESSEFAFEYGENFAEHIEAFQPTFCKVMVRYNPEGDRELNGRQAERLRRLSNYLHQNTATRFMFELLVPPEQAQLIKVGLDPDAYDSELRPTLTVRAIEQLYEAQIEPDVWKIDGFDRREDFQRIVATARDAGRDKVSCVVLGRSEDEKKVREWLTIAGSVPGFIGFAVGRTDFRKPLAIWRAKKGTREAAVETIAQRYREYVGIFEKARNQP